MTSRFVAAGSTEEGARKPDDWDEARKDVEEARQRKEDEGRQEGEKSLYDILQQNKAAKQEAFEESIRLKNQFRSLDEDEVEFLDSVLESTRAKEAALKKETEEQLEVFRKQQENADRALLNDDDGEKGRGEVDTVDGGWKTTSRKRRRVGEKEGLKGVKLRKSSSTSGTPDDARQKQGGTVAETSPGPHAPAGVDLEHTAAESATTTGQSTAEKAPIAASPTVQRAAKGLLSVDYGSDDDD
ncbi:MAG: hypothetical protein M1815_003086 [Lichina confinis]|nr:MAG: hypothetical protein M1815_003086 [Lichina confinis]